MVCYCSAGNDQNITVCPLLLVSDDKIFMMQLMFQMKIYCTNWYNNMYFTWQDDNYPWSQKYELSFQQVFLCNKSSHLKFFIKNTYKTSYLFHPTLFFFIIFAELFLEMIGFPVNLINTLIHIVLKVSENRLWPIWKIQFYYMHGMPISEIYTCTNNSQYLLKYEWGCRESYRFWEIFKTKIWKKVVGGKCPYMRLSDAQVW